MGSLVLHVFKLRLPVRVRDAQKPRSEEAPRPNFLFRATFQVGVTEQSLFNCMGVDCAFFFVLNSCIIFLGLHESSWSCSKHRVSVESGCSSVCPVTSPCSLSSLSARGGKGRSGALQRGAGARKARLVDVCLQG